jgi:hypothetical protein
LPPIRGRILPGETTYHLAARQARTPPQVYAARDRNRRLSYAELVFAVDRLATEENNDGTSARNINPDSFFPRIISTASKPPRPGFTGEEAMTAAQDSFLTLAEASHEGIELDLT